MDLSPGMPVTALIVLLIQSFRVVASGSDDISIHFFLEPNPRPGWFKDSTELPV